MSNPRVPNDNPIDNPSADVLGRAEVAESFAQHVLALDATEGAVVGLFGPWGSGKTSFLNLAKHRLRQSAYVLDFNPWLFSGTEQLVDRFFVELSQQIKTLKLKSRRRIGQGLKEYADALGSATGSLKWFVVALLAFLAGLLGQTGETLGLKPSWLKSIIGPLIVASIAIAPSILKVVGITLRLRHGSIYDVRQRAKTALRKSDRQIIVILDDVDRLTALEVQEVFKLVRLTASFPKLIYVVACDRQQVTHALCRQGISGSDYLDKIIQLPYHLPEIPRHTLRKRVQFETVQALVDIKCKRLDGDTWSHVLSHIVMPLIRNMRDVRRYCVAIRETVAAVGDDIALADVLGLEAIRLFLPQVFDLLPASIDTLTFPPIVDAITGEGYINLAQAPVQISDGDDVVEIQQLKTGLSKRHQKVVESMCEYLFTATRGQGFDYAEPREQAFQASRVACRSILRLYLERFYNEEVLSLADAERALKCMHDADALRTLFREVDAGRWPYIVTHLSGFPQERFYPKQVQPGLGVLWNLPEYEVEQLPDDGLLRNAVLKATRRLFTSLSGDSAARDRVALWVASRIGSLGAKKDFVKLVVKSEGGGSRIVSEHVASELGILVEAIGRC